jgi:UDP-N-acetylglucosamine transferase subunit ALG13
MDELGRLVREARTVVTHGGVGSILFCLDNGKRPIVVPRLRRFAETVDDHQLESARRFSDAGLVTLVDDPALLPDALEHGDVAGSACLDSENTLVREIRGYLHDLIPPQPAGAR